MRLELHLVIREGTVRDGMEGRVARDPQRRRRARGALRSGGQHSEEAASLFGPVRSRRGTKAAVASPIARMVLAVRNDLSDIKV
jgi:hypothetical protein